MADKTSYKDIFFNPFSKDNPVIVQVLGICSALAVTAKMEPALVMGISVIAVLAFSNVIISGRTIISSYEHLLIYNYIYWQLFCQYASKEKPVLIPTSFSPFFR